MRQPPEPELFFNLVWKIVRQIPAGQVSTYGQIASMLQADENTDPATFKRLSPQWVGTAMNNTPRGKGIPWQRVINSQGKISLPGVAATQQRNLLEEEGITFDAKGRVDFAVYGWDGPPEAWLRENGLQPPISLKPNTSGGSAEQLPLF